MELKSINTDLIDCSEKPVRNHHYYELRRHIKQLGVLNPITVRPKGKRFELVTGIYRLHCALDLKMPEITCHVVEMSDEEVVLYQLMQPVLYKPLSKEEMKCALERMLESVPIEEAAKRIGRTVQWIKRKLK